MKINSKALPYLALFLFSFFLFSSCKKINEATELGGDLIPVVDNVTTFDTIIKVQTFNELFTLNNDSIASVYTDEQWLGTISNDPLFGKTSATMYFQLKPNAFNIAGTPHTFLFQKTGNSLINLDSVVLAMNYVETYGDSNVPQSVQVYEIDQPNRFKNDSVYLIRDVSFTDAAAISPVKTFIPNQLNDSMTLGYKGERIANQLRIRLDNSFGNRLLNYDSTNAYLSDSSFNANFRGFAVRPQGSSGNAVVGINLTTNTRLAFYYRYNNNGTQRDTVEYFNFMVRSASANSITRDYSGSQLSNYLGGTNEDDLVFLQNTPGTFARIKIPGLDNVSNRVVHRAELIVEQVPDPSDILFTAPPFLFVDAFDPAKNEYRTIPFDFTFNSSGNMNYEQFGVLGKRRINSTGNPALVWNFNITRYIQHVLTNTEPSYELRILTNYLVRDYFRNGAFDNRQIFELNPTNTKGRVRVGGGNHPTNPMRLRIIYSKL